MSEKYNCEQDVWAHISRVQYWMNDIVSQLTGRARIHDQSKLQTPEKQVFDEYTPKLKTLTFGSDEYKAALEGMGAGLKHHYAHNRHHPEFYPNGISGMTLVDIVEMVCDWMAACQAKNIAVDLEACAKRFEIEPQLLQIIENTLRDFDYWNQVHGIPVTYFSKKGPQLNSDAVWTSITIDAE